jgi:hypothetical protein
VAEEIFSGTPDLLGGCPVCARTRFWELPPNAQPLEDTVIDSVVILLTDIKAIITIGNRFKSWNDSMLIRICFGLVLLAMTAGTAHASCGTMQGIARDSARAAANRNDQGHHEWFYAHARQRGALAENIAPTGSRGRAMAMWRASSGHASNLALTGPRFACKETAIACNHRNCFAAMEIGPADQSIKRVRHR